MVTKRFETGYPAGAMEPLDVGGNAIRRRPASWGVALLLLAPIASAGCAAAVLSTGRPAHVADVGHFSSNVGVDLSVSLGALDSVVAAADAITQASNTSSLTDDQKRTVFEGGAHLGFNPPTVIPHAEVDYVPLPAWEVGVRIAGSGLRVATRRQILKQDVSGIDLTVGLGVERSLFTPQIDSDSCTGTCVMIDSYERWNVDVSAVVGRHASWFRWWAGPRVLYSVMSESMTLTTPAGGSNVSVTGSVDGRGFYLGACAGAAMGFRNLFVGPELTIAGLIGDADVTALGSTTNATLNSVVFAPAFAIMGEL